MILELIRNNIVIILKTITYQNIIETTVRKDKFTNLPSAEFLYGKGRDIIDKYTMSTVCMFRIANIEKINEEYGRETGNETIIKVAEYISDGLSEEYVFVRYMGPKFVIVFSGVEQQAVVEYIEELKETIEELEIEEQYEPEDDEEIRTVSPRLNFVISTYYKGTGLESLAKRLEKYIDEADKEEADINYI